MNDWLSANLNVTNKRVRNCLTDYLFWIQLRFESFFSQKIVLKFELNLI